jgi:hypothetical protein
MDLFKRFYCIVFIIWFLGCSNVKIIDDIKEGDLKGFVKFTLEAETGTSLPMGVAIFEGPQRIGGIGTKNSLKVAKIPGNYQFMALLPNLVKHISVPVVDGMMTPVKIFYIEIRPPEHHLEFYDGVRTKTTTTYYYNLKATVEKFRPLPDGD